MKNIIEELQVPKYLEPAKRKGKLLERTFHNANAAAVKVLFLMAMA